MKTVCLMDSVSRANGGIFEAERRLQQSLTVEGVGVSVIGLRDEHTAADADQWLPLVPETFPVTGPRAFGYAHGFANALDQSKADLAYIAGLWKYPNWAALRWSKKTSKPLIVAPHGMLDSWALENSRLKKRVAAWLFQNPQLREAACLRALCPAEAENFRAYGLKNRICIIPNGIDLPALDSTAPRHPHFPPDRKVLLYLGRLHPKKGLADLIEAWARVQPERGPWLLAIAGWDQALHEETLKRQATDLGIIWAESIASIPEATSLAFLGPQFGTDKVSCYQSCDAFVLPSLSEGLPMVVLEAWAHAKPVLMTSACNLPEGFAASAAIQIEPENGIIDAGLRELFASSAAELSAMGQRGRTLAASQFDWCKVARQMAEVYSWIVDGGPMPAAVEKGELL